MGRGGLATLVFDLPARPVNLLSRTVLAEMEDLVAALARRRDVSCLVLLSGKEGSFVAGADVEELMDVDDPRDAERVARQGQGVFTAWSRLPFPTLAAIDGSCVGGGLELALACTQVAVSDRRGARLGFPEIRLGILPGWGGCTRLPPRVGLAAALDLILGARMVGADEAVRLGLADLLVPQGGFLGQVRRLALALPAAGERSRRRGVGRRLLDGNPAGRRLLFDRARVQTLEKGGAHAVAPLRAIEVVRVGVEQGEAAGLEAEARAIGELATSPACKNQVWLFQASERARRRPSSSPGATRTVRQVGVLGAGAMGSAIAYWIAAEGPLPVRLHDPSAEALARALAGAARRFERQVQRGRLSRPEARRRLALLRPALALDGVGACDVVLEAVAEDLEVKRRVLAEAAARLADGAVLATHTASLPVGELARAAGRPDHVVGMRFFQPVHRMQLVEVVVPAHAAPHAVDTVAELARRLGKTPVLVRDGPGFLVNRLLGCYFAEALWMLHEGHLIEEIDRAATGWGMPLGPLALADLIGVDVAVAMGEALAAAFPDRLPLPHWAGGLAAAGRLGARASRGFYRYHRRERGAADRSLYPLLGIQPQPDGGEAARLVDRLVLRMVDEAARCLAEGVVASPVEVDLALALGAGFPAFRGGLCRWADRQGIPQVVAELERLAAAVGDRFSPGVPLLEAAAAGGIYARWQSAG
ncbi:MAG TPA: 3-hydroxyacyl-CoA dehydrogenase NAD-binding domain-containing protein [Thermoanaerobaculia bacterium]|nr:3-hydroxyacyl-CoA dehydrogenase NAD-binding domain-containing protein [Thermoanaerobaculia bacterium]